MNVSSNNRHSHMLSSTRNERYALIPHICILCQTVNTYIHLHNVYTNRPRGLLHVPLPQLGTWTLQTAWLKLHKQRQNTSVSTVSINVVTNSTEALSYTRATLLISTTEYSTLPLLFINNHPLAWLNYVYEKGDTITVELVMNPGYIH